MQDWRRCEFAAASLGYLQHGATKLCTSLIDMLWRAAPGVLELRADSGCCFVPYLRASAATCFAATSINEATTFGFDT